MAELLARGAGTTIEARSEAGLSAFALAAREVLHVAVYERAVIDAAVYG